MPKNNALAIVHQYFPGVKRVEDAADSIAVEVTKKDGDAAVVRDHKGCAMAVACKRQGKLDGVIISVSTAYLVKYGVAKRYKLPPSVSREVVSFDRKGGFAPGIYGLRAPSPREKLGAEGHKNDDGGGPRTGKKKRAHHFTEGIRTVLGSKSIS